MTSYTTTSAAETTAIGRQIAETLSGGDIVLLTGDLGAGKTTLTKGILGSFGIDEHSVVSPTFTLMQVYPVSQGKIQQLVHIDTYRMEHEDELVEIGIEDHLNDPGTVMIIEWPEKLKTLLNGKATTNISLAHKEEHQRTIVIKKTAN